MFNYFLGVLSRPFSLTIFAIIAAILSSSCDSTKKDISQDATKKEDTLEKPKPEDKEPPSKPTNFTYIGNKLIWPASADASEPVKYDVYISATNDPSVTSEKNKPTETLDKHEFTFARKNESTYIYVVAFDAKGNRSAAGVHKLEKISSPPGQQPSSPPKNEPNQNPSNRAENTKEKPIRYVQDKIDLHKIGAFASSMRERYEELRIKGNHLGATDCRQVDHPSVKNTFLCLSTKMEDQNLIFTRASTYSEGSTYCPSENIVPFDHIAFTYMVDRIWGHDILSDMLVPFFKLAEEESKYTENIGCEMNEYEKSFKENVLKEIQAKLKNEKFVVITAFAELSQENLKEVVSHETLHAQYFMSSAIRAAVDSFWKNELNERERNSVYDDLKDFYDIKNQYVILNEFLAYMASYGIPRNVGYNSDYKPKFIKYVQDQSKETLFQYPE